MSGNPSSRRSFITAAAASAVSYTRILGANDRVRAGLVGFSDRAKDALIPAFLKAAPALNFELAAVSDIWNRRREAGTAFIRELTGRPVVAARNNEELYQRKDIDAAIIATADFQHALHGIEAVEAGRDAYIEKPLANTIADARAVLRAAGKSKRIVQVGTQRRSSPGAIKAREFLQSGEFGDLNVVHFAWRVNDPGRWRRPKVVPTLRQEDTDWERYLLNRPREAWNPRKYLEFRLFWPYSSGIPDQWLVHEIDLVHWFTGLRRPRSVVANGGVYQWRDGRTNADTLAAVFDYGPPDDMSRGFQVLFEARMANAAGGQTELFCSNAGALDLNTTEVSPNGGLRAEEAAAMGMKPRSLAARKLLPEAKEISRAAATGADEATSAHMRNWMECIRSRRTPAAGIRVGYDHSVALCMTIAALHTGKRIGFDDAAQDVVAR